MTSYRNIKSLLKISSVLLIVSLLLSACEEVVDIDLNSSSPVLVADGYIKPGLPASLLLSYTSDYFDNETVKYENGAVVTLSDNLGNSEQMQFQSNGLYQGVNMVGEVGREYTIEVTVKGKTQKAVTQMLTPVELLNLTLAPYDGPGSAQSPKKLYRVNISFSNNPEELNYFLFKFHSKNQPDQDGFVALSGEFFPENPVLELPKMGFIYEEGDEVTIQVFSIDEFTQTYYDQLDEALRAKGSGSTPFNPKSNFGPGMLGLFRAWSEDVRTIVIQP